MLVKKVGRQGLFIAKPRLYYGTHMLSKQDVIRGIGQKQSQLKSLGVSKLGLFGSFCRNEQTDKSDIDFFVSFTPGKKTFDNFMALSFLLEDMFHRRIELVTEKSLSPYLKPYILKELEYIEV